VVVVGPEAPAEAEASRSVSARVREHLPWLVATVIGGLVALVAAYGVWPHGTHNLDELVYLNQADALRHGHLTYDASSHVPDFRPYLTGVADDRVVFKYQPIWPAWLAGSALATGDHRPGLVVAGALAALAFWLLGRELTGHRWLGTATAALVVLSPIFVVHSGTALAYLPAAALAAAGLGLLLRGERLSSWPWLAGAGVALGALFFHRPFDAVMVGLPVAVWLLWRTRPDRRWRALAVVAVAAAPLVLGWLAHNQVVAGDALKPVFTVDAPADAFGFGERSSWQPDAGPNPELFDYEVGTAASTVGTFTAITPLWIGGGVITLGLVAVALVMGRGDTRRWLLLGTAGAVVVGYFFWWGTANFVSFHLHRALGPAYWLGAVGPLAALAVIGARDAVEAWWASPRWRPRPLLLGLGVVAVATVVVQVAYVDEQLVEAREIRDQQRAPLDVGLRDSVVLLPAGPHDPFVRAVVPADLAREARLHGVDLELPGQRFRLLDRFPDRSLWVWLPVRPTGTVLERPLGYRLVELTTTRAERLDVTATVTLPAPGSTITEAWLRTIDAGGDEIARRPLDPGAPSRIEGSAAAADGAAGDGIEPAALAVDREPAWLAVGATVDRGDGAVEIVEVRWAVRSVRGRVEVVGPGVGYRYYSFPDADSWIPEDVADRLTAAIAGLAEEPPMATIGPLP
jgi:hypothetical protein